MPRDIRRHARWAVPPRWTRQATGGERGVGSGLERFEAPTLLGRGGMGEVYRSAHRALGIPVAIKILTGGAAHRKRAFERELRTIARIDHPHVMDLLAGGTAAVGEWFPEDTRWMAMELARGALAERPPTRWSEAYAALRAVLSGLGTVHAHGILHRDLTPGNVLDCGAEGDPWWRLADFGLASVDGFGLRGGTPGFVSPELARGLREGPQSDLYSVGCLAWWMLHGRPPEEARWDPVFPLPDGVHRWVEALLAPAREDRPGSARAAACTLPPPGAERAPPPPPGRRPAAVSTTTWVEDEEVPADLPTGAPTVAPPDSWVHLGGDPHLPRTWGLRGLLASDPGLALLAEREPPLVGRIAERDALWDELLALCAGGSNRWIRLVGPPGVGTSRLAAWFREAVAASGAAALVDGPEGTGLRVWVADGGEPDPAAVAAAAPGLLLVSVGPGPGADRVLAVPPFSPAETAVLLGALGAHPIFAPWWHWWSGGRPAQILLRFEALLREDPAQLRALDRALPPETEAERAFAEAAAAEPGALEACGRRFAALSDTEVLPAGHLLACWRRVAADARMAWARRDSVLGLALAGELTAVAAVQDQVQRTLALVDQVLPEPWAGHARLLAHARPEDVTDPELRHARLLVLTFELHAPRERLAVAEAALAHRETPKALQSAVESLFDLGRLEDSAALAQRLSPEAGRGLAAAAVARTLRCLGRHEEARAWLDGVDDPAALPWVRLERGELARSEGDLTSAEHWYRSIPLSPARSDVLLNLAIVQLEGGRLAEAESTCLRVHLFPNEVAERAATLIRARIAARRADPTACLQGFARVDEWVGATGTANPDFLAEGRALVADLAAAGLAAEAVAVAARLARWEG
jgi:tetratricopeptide (TPR) repeat protein